MTGQSFREILEERVLIGDGAMGSYLYSRGFSPDLPFEYANILNPELVADVHRGYINAGADIIETNTFAANRVNLRRYGLQDRIREICLAGARLARSAASAAGSSIIVAGSVGPIREEPGGAEGLHNLALAFEEQASALLEGGVDIIILETFEELEQLILALRVVKSLGDVAVICQMTFHDEPGPKLLQEMVARLREAGADVIGANCGYGPLGILKVMEKLVAFPEVYLSAFPNASFPEVIGGRYIYRSNPTYFAENALRLAKLGVNVIGGCCGTTPEHIKLVRKRLAGFIPVRRVAFEPSLKISEVRHISRSATSFLDKIGRSPIITVELDPPKGASIEKVARAARLLRDAGVDAINVAENPLATVRMSSLVAGYLIQREAGLPAIVHLTCRDRNLIGQKSLILGASALGISSILAVTGDPVPRQERSSRITSVYDTGSYGLIELIKASGLKFNVGVAFNANARNLDAEAKRLERKVALGADFVETQPVFDLERLHAVYEATKGVGVPILIGILPLVSVRNAEFLHNEFPGIFIPDSVMRRLKGAQEEGALREGIEIAKELITEAVGLFSGVYIIPPFNRIEVALELVGYVASLSRHAS